MKTSSARANSNLNRAKAAKNDEFYTRVQDIGNEIFGSGCYAGAFRGKTVLCNCNDMGKSGFAQFFVKNFGTLGLSGLILTSHGPDAKAAFYDGQRTKYVPLDGNGDFRSDGCREAMRQADIVATNPPFSLFREFLKELVADGRQFLVVGNVNAMLCKDIFPLYMDGEVWYGNNMVKTFLTPEGTKKFGNIGWYTNMGSRQEAKRPAFTCRYSGSEARYPVYDNYGAINAGRVRDIPADYFGEMGVPGSYLLVHDPDMFEVIGTSGTLAKSVVLPDGTVRANPGRFYINGKRLYERVVIRRRA